MGKKITKKDLQNAGWIFSGNEGENAFINLLNKTLKTAKSKKEFLDIIKKIDEPGILKIKN